MSNDQDAVSFASPESALEVISAAHLAFPAWAAKSPSERRSLLWHGADLLLARSADVVAVMREEMGGTAAWCDFNVAVGAKMLREAAALTTQVEGTVMPTDYAGRLSLAVRQPAGVVLGIAPWNATVILALRAIATPLACGNTAVLKASDATPRTHKLLVDLLLEAGIPTGALGFVATTPDGAADCVAAMIADPRVRRVNFTGSTRVGRIIGKLSAEHMKPALLELGGKAPLVALDDADLDAAAAAASFGAFFNAGQICMSTERLIVQPGIADELVARIADRAEALIAGDPGDPTTQIGPLINDQAVAHVQRLIDDAKGKGARIVCGGSSEGRVYRPTVVDHVTPEMALYHQESFGPVLAVIRAGDDDDAVRLANDTDYGLSASVFSQDHGRAMAIADRIQSGICHINSATVQDEPQIPFGGVKDSGYGRFGGRSGVDFFTDLRWITLQGGPRRYPI